MRVEELLAQEQLGTLSPNEEGELEEFLHLEHVLTPGKAQARRHLGFAE